jgi:hypothetical protein
MTSSNAIDYRKEMVRLFLFLIKVLHNTYVHLYHLTKKTNYRHFRYYSYTNKTIFSFSRHTMTFVSIARKKLIDEPIEII